MSKKLTPLQKLTTKYKRKFHPWPLIVGILGNMIVAVAVVFGGVPEPFAISGETHYLFGQIADVVFFLTFLGYVAAALSSLLPLTSGIILMILAFIDTSAFLNTFDTFGLIGCLFTLTAAILCFNLRKDLLKKWGW